MTEVVFSKSKNRKISHLVCTFPPYKGGIGNACLSQAKMGEFFDYSIEVLTPRYKNLDAQKHELINNIKIKRMNPVFTYGNAGYINIKNNIKKTDILHIHYPFYFSVELAILWAKIFKKKILIFWHMIPESSGIKGLFFKFYEKIITPIIFHNADKILVSTNDYFENYSPQLFKKFKNKILEFPFGVDVNFFRPLEKDTDIINKYNLKNKKILLFVGGLDTPHYFKGLEILIKALKELDDTYIALIIGDGDLKQHYQNLVKQLHIDNKIIFIGSASNHDLKKYYNTCDCFIFPSLTKSEAFGIVQIEAMSCAKPIIYSDLPGVRTVPLNNSTGFSFKIGDHLDLKEKIQKLFNENLVLSYGKNARERILENYDETKLYKKLNSIYENLFN